MQTLEVVREGIAAGLWKNQLPGERELSRRLQVSRPTLRTALKLLDRVGCGIERHALGVERAANGAH